MTTGTPSLLRVINERTVLELLQRLGPTSRAQLARETGLSKPTVSQTMDALLAVGLVREVGRTSSGRGPAAVVYALNPSAGCVVGIDVGRRFVRAAVADITGTILARRDERSKARSSKALVNQVGTIARAVVADGSLQWSGVSQVVVGSPGVFERARGGVVLANNLPGWGRPGMIDVLREQLGEQVVFDNDVNLAALGEQHHGLGQGVQDFVVLSVGTGLGMGVVVSGRLHRGATGCAGEIGYLPLGADPHDPATRPRGALEFACAAEGVVAAARAQGMHPPLSAKGIFAAARRGVPEAKRVVEHEARQIALAIAAVVPVLDPELVVLTGGVGRNGDLLLEPVEAELARLTPFRPRIAVSKLDADAVLYGAVETALAAARERLFSRSPGAQNSRQGQLVQAGR